MHGALQLIVCYQLDYPDVQGVCSGAIFSSYQRNRVEHVYVTSLS